MNQDDLENLKGVLCIMHDHGIEAAMYAIDQWIARLNDEEAYLDAIENEVMAESHRSNHEY